MRSAGAGKRWGARGYGPFACVARGPAGGVQRRAIDGHAPASENALEADRCDLNFATGPLLHKQAIVESGRISGLRFGPLNERGGVESKDSRTLAKTPSAWFNDDADLVVRQWLDHMGERFTVDLVKQCASVARTDAFCANWSKQSAALDARLQELDRRAAELQQAVDAAQTNPLRNDELLEDLPKTVAGLQKDFARFTADIEELPDQLESERCDRRRPSPG